MTFSSRSLTRFLHPHYVINVLLGTIFFLLKTTPPFCTMLFNDCELEMREWELLAFLGCVIVMKNRKTPSYSMYLETACTFAKVLSVLLFVRQNYIYAAAYVAACLLHLLFLPEPVYRGPEYVTFFRGPHLEEEIQRDKRVTWLVEFYTTWAAPCISFAPVFSELSAKYSLDNLKFGKIDVGRYPDVAKKYNIDTSAWTKQLPSLVLFQNGKETNRRPLVDYKGKARVKFIFCMETVEREFELGALHHECKQRSVSTTTGGKLKKQ